MDSNRTSKPVGVIGGGSFGTVLSNLIAQNTDQVLFYVRDPERAKRASEERTLAGQAIAENVTITSDILLLGRECDVLFPAVPSSNFREMMVSLSPSLRPYHILIHGTKGFDLKNDDGGRLTRDQVKTMTEVIKEESTVVRIGCIAGPNLAREIAADLPAATVVTSPFDEVVEIGQKLLRNDNFLVYGGSDLLGTELCGILKNIIAIGAGLVDGLKLGENAKALLISRGLVEMIHVGRALGSGVKPFFGLAGVGDLIATCGSPLSRNYSVGKQIAAGKTISEITSGMTEVAEGVKTIGVVYRLSEVYKFRCVITEMLYKVMFGGLQIEGAKNLLMKLPFRQEIDFID